MKCKIKTIDDPNDRRSPCGERGLKSIRFCKAQ